MIDQHLDGRSLPQRRLARFIVFALVIVLAVGTLTARLFYLQIVEGQDLAAIAARNRTVLEAIVAPRGLIYDRQGRLLVSNVPTYAVKVRPADLPNERRDDVVARLAALIGMDPVDINTAIDGNPGSAFDLVRVARDVDKDTANLIAESRSDLPGVEVAVEARRQYTDGPLMSQLLGYTGPVSPEALADLRAAGLPARRPDRQGRCRGHVRDRAARHVRQRARRARRDRPQDPGPGHGRRGGPGRLARP